LIPEKFEIASVEDETGINHWRWF